MPGLEDLERLLDALRGLRLVVVGLGNPLMGDDGVGLLVARELARAGLRDFAVEAGPSPELRVGELKAKKPDVVLFVDAVDAGLEPGSVVVAPVPGGELEYPPLSTHALPLSLLLSLVGAKGYLVGIQAERVGVGEEMSPRVREAGLRVARAILSRLSRAGRG